jgi:hypothetical protein
MVVVDTNVIRARQRGRVRVDQVSRIFPTSDNSSSRCGDANDNGAGRLMEVGEVDGR